MHRFIDGEDRMQQALLPRNDEPFYSIGRVAAIERKFSPRLFALAFATARIATPIASTTAPWNSGWKISAVFGPASR
jgi:hypothetical protein